jgi:hypothetical protein
MIGTFPHIYDLKEFSQAKSQRRIWNFFVIILKVLGLLLKRRLPYREMPGRGNELYTVATSYIPPTSGLLAWYDSNSAVFSGGGVLTSWKDKGRYNNNVTSIAPGPQANSLFRLTSNLLFSPNIEFRYIPTGLTVFAVCSFCNSRVNAPVANNIVTLFTDNYNSNTRSTPSNSAFALSVFNTSSTSNFILNCYDTSNYVTYSNNLVIQSYPNRVILNSICFNSNFAGSFSRAYINGSNVSCNANYLNLSSNISTYNIWIGDYFINNGNIGRDGRIHYNNGSYSLFEILIYGSVLKESDINSINQYLSSKNGTSALANFTY